MCAAYSKHCIATVTWAWSPARTLGLVLGAGACVWGLGGAGAWSDAWVVALAWLGTHLVCPGWCLGWLASAKPPGHRISQSFHTNARARGCYVFQPFRKKVTEFFFEGPRVFAATSFAKSSARKFRPRAAEKKMLLMSCQT